KTVLYTLQSNRVAKRFNCTLLEGKRALSFMANIPSTLWADLAASAVHIRNRLPHQSNRWRSPYELLYGTEPSVEHLWIIWSDAYVHINKSQRKGKLGPRAQKLKLIGYEEDYAYCLWNPYQRKVIISRDIVFNEFRIMTSDYTPPTDTGSEWEVGAILDENLIDGTPYYKMHWA